MPKVLVVATSRKTKGGITSVVKAHETGEQWKKFHRKWIETHRDGNSVRKLWYLATALIEYICLLPFYDIVHIHVGLRTSVNRKLIFARIALLFRKKIIVHFHPATEKHLFDPMFSGNIKHLFELSNKLLVLSPKWIEWINEAYRGNKYNIQVLYNPCPSVKRSIQRENYILYAGILSDRKGYNRLIEAFSKIAAKYPDWKIKFAGNGEIEKGKSLAVKFGIEQQTEFLGWIAGNTKESIFQHASIYCLPSWGEGFPMGVIDAIAYGIPVITTPVGGLEKVFHDGIDAMIYETYDLKMLADKLEQLIKSETYRNSIVNEADKLVCSDFNIITICNKIEKIYENM